MDDREMLIGRIKAAKWDAKLCRRGGLAKARRNLHLQEIEAQLEAALKLIEEAPISQSRINACVGIARQVCGHAYPDRSFDELSAGDISDVQHNLSYADETLAQIMPIVVDQV